MGTLTDDPLVHLNGEMLPLSQARVSVLDRGFIFGDGVYEVLPVYARRSFRLAQHLARLRASLAETRIRDPYTPAQWEALFDSVIAANPWDDQSLYLQVTRGVARRDHAFPADAVPTVFVMVNPLAGPSPELRARGVAAVTMEDNRWLRCNVKSVSLIGNVLLRQDAVDRDAVEAILLRDGWLTEGSSTNVFIVREGVIAAPPKSRLILPGITYDVVVELARANDIPLELRPVAAQELRSADEVWLASSIKELLAATELDGRPVGRGAHAGLPGPVLGRMHALYQELKASYARMPAHA